MNISLCMIIKNEEAVIGRCLDCVKDIFDEIIIVDTGSIDNTKNICVRYTDKIYDFVWCDDFSAARNFAFSKASCNYLFWLDADDIIEKDDLLKISELKKRNVEYDTYMFKYVVAENADGAVYEFYRERLFKKCDKSIFKGFIHECVVPFGKIGYFDIKIKHRKNYDSHVNQRRNLDIFLKHKKAGEVFDARTTYYFAKEYFYLSDFVQCEKILKEFLLFKRKNVADVRDALLTLYRCSHARGEAQIEYLNRLLTEVGGDAEALTLTGMYYREKSDFNRAEMYYKFALCVDETTVPGFIYKPYYYLYPLLELVSLYYAIGKKGLAANIHHKLKELYPNNEKVVFNEQFFDDKNTV